MNAKQFRQGDVMIQAVDGFALDGASKVKRENGRVVLANGEVTGHAHAICDAGVDLWQVDGGVTILEITTAMALLKHEEHATVSIPNGTYKVTRQREYSPEAIRNVAD